MSGPNWTDRPILVLGAKGMLGHDLVFRLESRLGQGANDRIVAVDKDEMDITQADAVHDAIKNIAPKVVLNLAAYTNVDGCESSVDLAMEVNARAPEILARACHEFGVLLVQISTDFVFDGNSRRPYCPNDPANPLSIYGRSKWEGEEAIRASGCRHLIVRTSWLYGPHGRNFVEAILQRTIAGESLRVVDDQVGRPTYTIDLSDALMRLLDAGAEGTVHFANDGQCSWHAFATAIVASAGIDVPVAAISSEELNRPARRPRFSVLDLSKYREWTDHQPRPWRLALTDYMRRRDQSNDARAVRTG